MAGSDASTLGLPAAVLLAFIPALTPSAITGLAVTSCCGAVVFVGTVTVLVAPVLKRLPALAPALVAPAAVPLVAQRAKQYIGPAERVVAGGFGADLGAERGGEGGVCAGLLGFRLSVTHLSFFLAQTAVGKKAEGRERWKG
ncbi:MAG: hypothetical protein LQ348_005932 [Seirophora lacunosa]|nr:MAG: hypothetical protein LQ348_005932 [Seirophora lacunosa]